MAIMAANATLRTANDNARSTGLEGRPAGGIISASLLHHGPSVIRVEVVRCGGSFCGGLPQIFLEQHSFLVDHEGHHARVTVFRRISDEPESAGHFPIDDIALSAAARLIGLPLQHVKEVAVERHVRIGLCAISFGGGKRHQGAQWALRLPWRRLPVQAVLLARITDELQGVLLPGCTIVELREILGLSGRYGPADVNARQFVPANTAIENLLLSSSGVEEPLSISVFLQWDGKG